jgi:hypothetical protein
LCELSAQCVGLHEVRERALSVDLDDRQRLPVAGLELGVTGDVHLLELEGLLGPHGLEYPPRRRAQVAFGRVVEADADYG